MEGNLILSLASLIPVLQIHCCHTAGLEGRVKTTVETRICSIINGWGGGTVLKQIILHGLKRGMHKQTQENLL